jgi:4-amino-4-deoxy-L-arabinose transferase-like glycosyltransferase
VSAAAAAGALERERSYGGIRRHWPLAAVLLLAAALRLSTLDVQSFWYDEAFTPVRVLHASLSSTLHGVVHTENSPPLWYLLAWLDVRLFGDGEIALRLPSALAGIALVAVAWGIGRELGARRCALATAALVAANPLFVWYSQEARVYELFALTSSLALLCCLRARRTPTRARMAAFALTGVLALLTHYFSVFLLAGMVAWLLSDRATRRAALPAAAAIALAGAALLPLVIAQGGHGTQWIERWALSSRLEAIPQYYLTGASGAPLGHGIELLIALPLLAALALAAKPALFATAGRAAQPPDEQRAGGAARVDERSRSHSAAAGVALVCAAGILVPLVLAIAGADYLAPRNLIAAMVPLTAVIAFLCTAPGLGSAPQALTAAAAIAFLVVSVDVDLSPRLQRGNWRAVARALGRRGPERVLSTVELGAAPLEYYLPPLRNLPRGTAVAVDEIDEIGYSPLRPSTGRPPARGFSRVSRRDIDGLIVYGFRAPSARLVGEATLRRHVITLAHPEVLVAPGAHVTSVLSGG